MIFWSNKIIWGSTKNLFLSKLKLIFEKKKKTRNNKFVSRKILVFWPCRSLKNRFVFVNLKIVKWVPEKGFGFIASDAGAKHGQNIATKLNKININKKNNFFCDREGQKTMIFHSVIPPKLKPG